MCKELDGQLTWSDLGISFGRMSLEHSQAESKKEQTSKPSLKRSQKSSAKKLPLFLSLKRDGLKPDASAEWVTAAAPFPSLGDYMMGNTGEQPSMLMEECGCEELPSGVSVSRLSQILEDSPLPKYSLSAKACMGILNRAQKRGKELPSELREALERQCGMDKTGGGGLMDGVMSFDPSTRFGGVAFKDVATTVVNGTSPGAHGAIGYSQN